MPNWSNEQPIADGGSMELKRGCFEREPPIPLKTLNTEQNCGLDKTFSKYVQMQPAELPWHNIHTV